MKSSSETPPAISYARFYKLSEETFPLSTNDVLLIIEEDDLIKAFKHLSELIKSTSSKAKAEGNVRRGLQLSAFEKDLESLKMIIKPECLVNHEVNEVVVTAFNRLYERTQLEFSQFKVDGNAKRVAEVYNILEALESLKQKALNKGLVL